MFDTEFKNDVKEYLNTPNNEEKDSYARSEDTVPILEKNTANLANIVAVAQTSSARSKPKVKPRVKSKPKPKRPSKIKKKKFAIKKMTTFKILRKNK